MPHFIGLDIGGTSLKSVVMSDDGAILDRVTIPIDAASPDWPSSIKKQLAELEQKHGLAEKVGLAAPGIARPDGRSIWWMEGRLSELMGLDWTTFLNRPVQVPVLNDARAALLAEAWVGAAAGQQNVTLLTLGTGVGGAAMVDGRLLQGAVGRAGHLGHLSLDPDGPADIVGCPGSLEEAVGNCSIQKRTSGRFTSVLALAAAAEAGDSSAAEVWSRSVRALSAGIASIINVLDPETILIGGGIAGAGDRLFQPLAAELEKMEWRPHGHRVRILPAMLGEYAGAIGAARYVSLCHPDQKC